MQLIKYLFLAGLLFPFGVGTMIVINQGLLMEEICDNALDDDEDGLIDLNDPDCDCPVLEPVSAIPNPSFEDMNCCPQDISQLSCADTWIQASEATTDYLHTCGWMGWEELPPPLPFPDGEGRPSACETAEYSMIIFSPTGKNMPAHVC